MRKAEIEFTDRRFAERFSRFPMRHVWPDMLSVLPAQTRRASGEIRTPDAVRNGDYDLICIGSPTWWRDHEHADALFLKVGRSGKAPRRHALRRVRRVPSLLARKLQDGAQARGEAGRSVRGRGSFRVSRRAAPLPAFADQLPGVGRIPRPVHGRAHSDDQRPAGAAGADAGASRLPSRIGCSGAGGIGRDTAREEMVAVRRSALASVRAPPSRWRRSS